MKNIKIQNIEHPYQQTAIRIIDSVIEPLIGKKLTPFEWVKIKHDLVALIDNMEVSVYEEEI